MMEYFQCIEYICVCMYIIARQLKFKKYTLTKIIKMRLIKNKSFFFFNTIFVFCFWWDQEEKI